MALERITLDDIRAMSDEANQTFRDVKDLMTDPRPLKTAPTFSMPYIADLCNIDRTKFRYLSEKHGLPYGTKVDGAKTKEFSLSDVITWSKTLGNFPKRPPGKRGKVVTIAMYKGGVGKSTLAIALAQAFTLMGYKVGVGDLDPQGSSTQIAGLSPKDDVLEEDTIMPLIYGEEPDLRYAIKPTYWENLHLIPASNSILAADFYLPSAAKDRPGFQFWNVLRNGLEPLRDDFDIIILDTPPSLSYLTINALIAADGLIMPCPPDSLDFASSVQFWAVFSELMDSFSAHGMSQSYDFLSVVYSKVKTHESAVLVKNYMARAYGKYINAIEIPESAAASSASAQLKTIYDIPKPEGSKEAHRRIKDPLDQLARYVIDKFAASWMESDHV